MQDFIEHLREEHRVKLMCDYSYVIKYGVLTWDTRTLFGFGTEHNGGITNRVWGRLGVVRKENEYVVIWQPLDK